tara:strand:+ start:41 stop:772 length:732 start_codon:yes stop_codon:yes gene_type:complete
MGFLDHSTNNIIVDAVLTDIGRQMLAANDGSFRINQFALGDDEIDYGIIKKFGRNVGQEKIEKNTPIMEALTRSNLSVKHKLVSISNPYLTHFPVLELSSATGASVVNEVITLNNASSTASSRNSTLQFTVSPKTGRSINNDLVDDEFFVEINSIFLRVLNDSVDIHNIDNTAVYRIGTTSETTTNNVLLKFQIGLRGFSTSQFNTYSVTSGTSTYVKTFVKVTGATSGLTKNVELRIKNSSS